MRRAWIVAIATCVGFIGCGKGEGTGKSGQTGSKGSNAGATKMSDSKDAKTWNASAGTAEIRGKAVFVVKAPKRKAHDTSKDPKCAEIHPDPILQEFVVVNDNGTLRNVFVYVKEGLDNWKFPTPAGSVELDQKGCCYVPHVQGLQLGQGLKVKNGDPVTHNVHSHSKVNATFNPTQTPGREDAATFQAPEIMVRVSCDIHPWMSAYVGVVEHPFFAVTGEDGTFKLPKLPPGEYTLEAWHEELGTQTATVKVGDKESKDVEFKFEEK